MDTPHPTEQDQANARLRQEIADRQARDYAEVLAWAEQAFGAGWLLSHRHYLLDRDEEYRARATGERPHAAATVYTVKNAEGQQRHFMVEGEKITEHASYQEAFGPMLLEPHATRGFEHQGQWHAIHRYSLCWSPYELYQPKTAEQLAALRANRERRKTEREEKQWAEDNPLLAWADTVQTEEPPGKEPSR
jgi:hypothetical protein